MERSSTNNPRLVRLWPELLALCLVLAAAAPFLVGRFYYLDDITLFSLPRAAWVQRTLQAGDTGWWNQDLFGGYPGLAAGQSQWYYPPARLLLAWLPLTVAVRALYVLHFWLLARGMVALATELGLSLPAAGAAAAVALLGGTTAGHHQHLTVIAVMGWTPPLLWLAARVVRRARARFETLALMLAVGAALVAGSPQYAMFAVAGVFTLAALAREQVPARVAWARVGGALAAGALLAAAQLLPSVEYARVFPRPEPLGHFEFVAGGGLASLRELVRLLHPDLWGSPLDGRWPGQAFHYWETRAFAGATFLALACALGGGSASVARRVGGVWVLLAGALALGRLNPLWRVLVYIPPFSLFRLPARWLWLGQLGLALLAGDGVERLRAGEARQLRWWAWVAPVVLLVRGLAGGLALAGVAGVRWAIGEARPARLRLVLGVGVLELLLGWHSFARTAPVERWQRPPRLIEPILRSDDRRVLIWPRPATANATGDLLGTLAGNVGELWGLSVMCGYEALPPHQALALERVLGEVANDDELAGAQPSAHWVLSSRELHTERLQLVARDGQQWLYLNRCQFAQLFWFEDSPDRPTRLLESHNGYFAVEVDAVPGARRLVGPRNSLAYPGWNVTVDGQPATWVDVATVELTPGRHRLVYEFDSFAFELGLALSKVALCLWLLGLLRVCGAAVARRSAASG